MIARTTRERFAIDRHLPALDLHNALQRALDTTAPSTCEQCGHDGHVGDDLVLDYLYAGRGERPVIACRNLTLCWQRIDRSGR